MDKQGRLVQRLVSYGRWQLGRATRAPGYWLNLWLGNWWNDHWLARKRQQLDGLLAPSGRFAVYVVFPRYGIRPSHLASLGYLLRHGLTPVIVSNLALSDADRRQLLPMCWRLIERPNFGYDFGAYREGVLALGERLPGLSQLLLVNDSVWFPVPSTADWLKQAEALGVDLAAAASNYGFDSFTADPSRKLGWRYDPLAPRLHYCSFALLFGARVLADPEFLGFWRKLRLTSDKQLTVGRGEVGLSRWVIEQGYSHNATLDLCDFDQVLARMDEHELHELVGQLIIPEDVALRQEQLDLIKAGPGSVSREDLQRFILWAVADTGPAYALPYWSLEQQQFGFLKKSPLWLSMTTADITESLVIKYGGSDMLAEARQLRQNLISRP